MKFFFTLVFVGILVNQSVWADNNVATLRNDNLSTQNSPPPIANVLNEDIKRKRSYPMQPPTIPHKIDNYQVDIHTNKCLSCHSRKQTEQSQAPMVSVTHYMDREGNFLATVSPRRYFCTQCHVIQTNSKLIVESEFKDIDDLISNKGSR